MSTADVLTRLTAQSPDFNPRNFLETLAILAGTKLAMRLSVHDGSEAPIRGALESLGLQVIRSRYRQKTSFETNLGDSYTTPVPFTDGGELPYTVMVAMDRRTAIEAMEMEDEACDFRGLGEMLGYPECCIQSYEDIGPQRDWLRVWLSNTPLQFWHDYRANKLAYLFSGETLFFDYFPCSATCQPTMCISSDMEQMLAQHGLEHIANAIRKEMQTPVIFVDGILVQLRGCTVSKDGARLEYGLSSSRRWLWELREDAPDHLFWSSSRLQIDGEHIYCFDESHCLGLVEQHRFNRLMLFR